MLRFLCLMGMMALSIATRSQSSGNSPALIPLPAHYAAGSGQLTLRNPVLISAEGAAVPIAAQLSARLQAATGYSSEFVPEKGSTANTQISFRLNARKDTALAAEGYRLTVNEKGILIQANTAAGLFYGCQTLLQLLPPQIESKTIQNGISWIIPYASVTDRPRFGYRGLMLDVARHFFTKQQVKDFIDNMVKYKYNRLHLHLTDDQGWRIEIKSLPRLVEVGAYRPQRTGRWGEFTKPDSTEAKDYGGYYTQEDIKEIIRYAQDRFVTILPEIDIPGHSMALIAAYPELVCTPGYYQVNAGNRFMIWPGGGHFYGLEDNNLCPANEKVYEVLDKIFTEVAALFPYEYIHMGGDETYKGFWEKSDAIKALMVKEKLKNMDEVQSYFVKRVARIIASKGKKMIGWDEILQGGIAPGAAVMSWQGEKGGIEAAKLKHPVVMSPSTYTYVDLYQGDPLAEPPTYSMLRLKKSYAFNPVPAGVDSAYILGGQANLWSERLHTVRHAEYMLWPRGWAVAESVWSMPAQKDWKDFVTRTEAHFARSGFAGTNYSRSMYDPIVTVKKIADSTLQVSLATEVDNLQIHYSFDEFYPDQFYPVYSEPLVFPKGASSLKIVTYRGEQKMGREINLPLTELWKRVK
ncbi:beta-N-acetylhexosaminidase [Flavihumibacter petaseus]|uniref:beta-N-acetylhexosaminidase n=1 Tax=Flavihumibacter petaseus NBRC 106054 TaxID=1220578 RepID=A0A0E9N1L3_9BACT|nr:beta-N-acetylhexosaminidase [Flavihumibacter petaseus]GAO43668.1 beta-N-acetylhexosaminidase [Flavihumibacter petaseus NBRC 106054]